MRDIPSKDMKGLADILFKLSAEKRLFPSVLPDLIVVEPRRRHRVLPATELPRRSEEQGIMVSPHVGTGQILIHSVEKSDFIQDFIFGPSPPRSQGFVLQTRGVAGVPHGPELSGDCCAEKRVPNPKQVQRLVL